MLDRLLGRTGFCSKCKSLIKLTRTRIDGVRRKRCATQKFLRKDIADLLANGLETNAYGRAEGLVKELILSSCYDFIDHVCEIILKRLPYLRKLRECPEDCREAVASLMFAAARFSDLPDLRVLRDLFQERYGSSLEYFVNPKLAENIILKPPSMKKKVQLLQEIALEFSIPWDSSGFEERTYIPSALKQNQTQSPDTVHATESKVTPPFAEEFLHKTGNDEVLTRKMRDELKRSVFSGPEIVADIYMPPSFTEETIQKREENVVYHQRRKPKVTHNSEGISVIKGSQSGTSETGLEFTDSQREDNVVYSPRREPKVTSNSEGIRALQGFQFGTLEKGLEYTDSQREDNVVYPERRDPKVTRNSKGIRVRTEFQFATSSHGKGLKVTDISPKVNRQREDTVVYSPRREPKVTSNSEGIRALKGFQFGTLEKGLKFTDSQSEDNVVYPERREPKVTRNSKGIRVRTGFQFATSSHGKGLKVTDIQERSPRMKPDDVEPGLKSNLKGTIPPPYVKPSKSKPESVVTKPEAPIEDETDRFTAIYYKDEFPHHITENETNFYKDSTPTTSRSMSLPPQLVSEPPPKKVFTRADTFQPDNPAKHVHPKLPDFEDLAARFSTLRASKD